MTSASALSCNFSLFHNYVCVDPCQKKISTMDKQFGSKKKLETKKYLISESENYGRYLMAAKDLSAGEVILCEDAAAVGPAIFDTCGIFCFSCLRPLHGYDNKVHYACSKCNVAPLCNLICENSKISHHSAKECALFCEKKDSLLANLEALVKILFLLRLWLLKEGDRTKWNAIWSMEAHLDERRNTLIWADREKNVANVFRKLDLHAPIDLADESLQRLCGIVDVNSFELRCPSGSLETAPAPLLTGLFLESALMAHSCRSNVHIAVDEHFRMTVYASVPIAAGEPVFNNYTSSLLGTAERQEHLKVGKYFHCECKVCEDPLEGGTYLSCILCPRCRKDYVAIQKPINDTDPHGKNTNWQCRNCNRIFKGCLIKRTVEISQDLINYADHSKVKEMENLLHKLSTTFHKNHYVMLALKQKLLAVYRNEMTHTNPQRKILLRILELSSEIMDVLEIVEPGISRLKGIMLYEMHLPKAILAHRAYVAREITAKDVFVQLIEAQGFLRRSLSMLLLEPMNTPEGLLARRALQEMKLLTQNVEDAKALAFDSECSSKKCVRTRQNPNRRNKVK